VRVRPIQPDGWAPPRGYANGVLASGHSLYVAGQIGWGPDQRFASDQLTDQFAQALENVLAVVRAAGGEATDIAQMTIYVTDVAAYRAAARELGAIWRARLGKHYPAMALVGVTELVEPRALVEIQAIAHL
jgi:enamine deaminase RidA (YjgF/YER057c/UK114 family)